MKSVVNSYSKLYVNLGIIILICSISYKLQAQYVWPTKPTSIKTISSVYGTEQIYALIGIEDSVYSIGTGIVQLVRDNNEVAKLPGIIELRTEDNIVITYLYVNSFVVIGDRVKAGDILGSIEANDTLYISMYDINTSRYIDPLFILPNLDRNVVIKLLSASFVHQNPEQIVAMSRRIKSGNAKLLLNIKVYDAESEGMLTPETILVNIRDNEYILTKDEIQQQIYNKTPSESELTENQSEQANGNSSLQIAINQVEIPRGYMDIIITIKSVLGSSRTLRFNIFAN